ncbi:hypothetical protein [Hyphomonas sp.]|jgi:hypothetical protein|uniref:hypothetical protein n=1 Tax=Hyphomonas sp. TaxID=87 RepID=UPI0025B9E0A7|nr:hypothetical protein [Hyphomonas sp.]
MAAAFYILMGGFIVWLVLRAEGRREARLRMPDARDEAINRLNARVRSLEEIVTDRDWRLRRDIDKL